MRHSAPFISVDHTSEGNEEETSGPWKDVGDSRWQKKEDVTEFKSNVEGKSYYCNSVQDLRPCCQGSSQGATDMNERSTEGRKMEG